MKNLALYALLLLTLPTFAQTDKKLTKQLEEAVKGFNGDVGIYVRNIKTGKTAAFNADSIFPTASMIKRRFSAGLWIR